MNNDRESLSAGGARLWDAITGEHELTETQMAQLAEACRAKDRLDGLDVILRGDADTWAKLVHNARTDSYELKIDAALTLANTTANTMKQLLAALRLPDPVSGKVPQYRGSRVQVPSGSAPMSSLDRARNKAA